MVGKIAPAAEPKLGLVVYENTNYYVTIGIPPATDQFPNPRAGYLVISKETGVEETFHSIRSHAVGWADSLSEQLMADATAEVETIEATELN